MIDESEIENHGSRDERDAGPSEPDSDTMFFEVFDDSTGRVEAECTTSREDDSINRPGTCKGVEQGDFPASGCGSPYLHPGDSRLFAQDHGAAGAVHKIGMVTDSQAGDICDFSRVVQR